MQTISKKSLDLIKKFQQNEITEHHVYLNIARKTKDEKNRQILERIADEELRHYKIWLKYTGTELKPERVKVFLLGLASRLLGFTFIIKKMENGEMHAQSAYADLATEVAEALVIKEDENRHEADLIDILDEERLQYVGSMVLGLNDALVELTGTLAGLTLALQSTKLVALSGLITGISATLSMAGSEYLSARSEGRADALKSSLYTGVAYLITVGLMTLPYLLFGNEQYMLALGVLCAIVVTIIVFFNYYVSVCKNSNFRKRVTEMLAISLGIALLSFVIGLLVKRFLGIDV